MTKPADQRGGTSERGGSPSPRQWNERLDDPNEPLYTVGVAADLLGVDTQTIRRLHDAALEASARPSGNQRRYSRHDIEILAAAAQLTRDGIAGAAIGRILELERRLHDG